MLHKPWRIFRYIAASVAAESGSKQETFTHYCVTRADIPIGRQAAMLIHAAGESSPGNLPPHTFAIALEARDESHLDSISKKLFESGIAHKRIVETDAPYKNQLMAIGVRPMERSKVRPYLSELPLLGRGEKK